MQKLKQRACLSCSRLGTLNQFKEHGCENCTDMIGPHDSNERILENTSDRYTGFIAMIDPKNSWVARWQHIDEKIPGIYAIKVLNDPKDD